MRASFVQPVVLLSAGAAAFAIGLLGGSAEPQKRDASSVGIVMEKGVFPTPGNASVGVQESTHDVLLRATSHPSELHRMHAMLECIRELRPEGFQDAVAAALFLPEAERAAALRQIYTAWAEMDPRAAWQDCSTRGGLSGEFVGVVVQTWARRDLSATIEFAAQITDQHERRAAFYCLNNELLELGSRDPAAMLRLLQRPEIAASIGNIADIMGRLAKADGAVAAQQALALPSSQRGKALHAVFSEWGASAPREALAWIAAQPGDLRFAQELQTRVIRGWAGSDAPAAQAYVATLAAGRERDSAMCDLAIGLLPVDPSKAAGVAAKLPIASLLAVNGFFASWAEKDAPAAATALGERLIAEGGARPESTTVAATAENIYAIWARKDPQAAAQYALSAGGFVQEVLLPAAAVSLTRQNRAAAVAWVQTLPPGDARAAAYRAITSEWARQSAKEVADWLPTLPRGVEYEEAVTGFAGGSFFADPSASLEWVRTIPDAKSRERALQAAWTMWREHGDFFRAEEWVEQSPELSVAERAALKKLMDVQ